MLDCELKFPYILLEDETMRQDGYSCDRVGHIIIESAACVIIRTLIQPVHSTTTEVPPFLQQSLHSHLQILQIIGSYML
jgi:hypothetical protein